MKLLRNRPATVRGRISVNLVIVLAVITGGVAALAYEWCHAQAVKRQQSSIAEHHHVRYVEKRPENH